MRFPYWVFWFSHPHQPRLGWCVISSSTVSHLAWAASATSFGFTHIKAITYFILFYSTSTGIGLYSALTFNHPSFIIIYMTVLSMNQSNCIIMYQCISYAETGFKLCHYQHGHVVLESVLLHDHVPIYLLPIYWLWIMSLSRIINCHFFLNLIMLYLCESMYILLESMITCVFYIYMLLAVLHLKSQPFPFDAFVQQTRT